MPAEAPSASDLLASLTRIGDQLDQLDFRQGPDLSLEQARQLLRARKIITTQLEAMRRS
jgi:hypothetical protein